MRTAPVWLIVLAFAGDRALLLHNALHLTTSGGIVLLRLAKTKRMGQDALGGHPLPT